jgi:small subunit ribosomal protein S19e
LIEEVASDLEKKVDKPEWTEFVKTGGHRERSPHRRDWFYVRMASVFYRVYKEGPLGTNRLRTYYGGKRNRGVKPHHFTKASGKVIRTCLQELEKIGYLKKSKKGRIASGKGEKYLNSKAVDLGKQLAEKKEKKGKKEREKKAGKKKEKGSEPKKEKKSKREPSEKERPGKKQKRIQARLKKKPR